MRRGGWRLHACPGCAQCDGAPENDRRKEEERPAQASHAIDEKAWAPVGAHTLLRPGSPYWQVLSLNEEMLVAQLKEPFEGMYSVVKTMVQPSTGSTLMVL